MSLKKLLPAKVKVDEIAQKVRPDHLLMFCGDGFLKDDSDCAQEFRAVLKKLSVEKLEGYMQNCLEQEISQCGRILSDVTNEFGCRLGFEVSHAAYESHDATIGRWHAGDLVWDVKLAVPTSPVAHEALMPPDGAEQSAVLVVVSQDEPLLAAQIRGSGAWKTRLVKCQALANLAARVEKDGGKSAELARAFFLPEQHTQVDSLVDLFIRARSLVAEKPKSVPKVRAVRKKAPREETAPPVAVVKKKRQSRGDLISKRDAMLRGLEAYKGFKFERKNRSGSSYFSEEANVRVCLGLSKHYGKGKPYYLFSLTQTQIDHMSGGVNGCYVMGCLDKDTAYAVPTDLIRDLLPHHKKSQVPGGPLTWQLKIMDGGESLIWHVPGTDRQHSLLEYAYPLIYTPKA